MNDTKKITIVSACAFLLAFGGLFLYVKLYESTLISDSTSETVILPSSIKKIFLIGGSNTLTINTNHIENLLFDKGFHQYRVYNLGKIFDSPTLRLNDFDLLISAEPTLVVYGTGFRGLGYQEFDNRHVCSAQEELLGDYLSDLERELKRDENTLTFLPDDNEILPAVKDISKYFEQTLPNQPDIFSNFANPKHVTVNVLRMILEDSDITEENKRAIPGIIDNKLWHWGSLNKFTDIVSLEDIQNKLEVGVGSEFSVCPEDLQK